MSAIMLAWSGKKLHVSRKKNLLPSLLFCYPESDAISPVQDGPDGNPLFNKHNRDIEMT